MYDDDMAANLMYLRSLENDNETLNEAIERARATGRFVYWRGHSVSPQGNLHATND